MKTLLSIAAVSMIAMGSAHAVSFSKADSLTGITSTATFAAQAGNGLVSIEEAKRVGISAVQFDAADINGDRQLTPTEFKNLS